MHDPVATVLALDLEGTRISNAMGQVPRPGLYRFLARCRELFPRVVMFTTIREDRFSNIARLLVDEGKAPDWFADIELVHWQGATKDLAFIPGAAVGDALLVDDFEQYAHPGQEGRWMRIDFFDYPYEGSDTGLARMFERLERCARLTMAE